MIDRLRGKPNKSGLIDELDVQIEEHRRIFNNVEKAYDRVRADAERNAKKGLMRAAKTAYKYMKFHQRKLETIEITRLRLSQVRTSLVAMPDRLPTKTLTGVNKLLRESRVQMQKAERDMNRVLDSEDMFLEMYEDDDEAEALTQSDIGFSDFLKDIGLEAETEPIELAETPESVPVVEQKVPDFPSVPSRSRIEPIVAEVEEDEEEETEEDKA